MEGKGKGVEEREWFNFGPSKRKVKLNKKGGPSTPSPTWRLELCSSINGGNTRYPVQEFLSLNSGVSARKLCANLWELQPQLHLPFPRISKKGIGTSKGKEKDDLELTPRARLAALPSSSGPGQQPGAYMGNDNQTLVRRNHRSVGRYGHARKHLSPSSRGGSMEGKKGESNNKSKTSAELLKVLNKIWSLEEQQASNISALKALKRGLQHSELQIEELQDDKQKHGLGMGKLKKQVAEDKTSAWSREREQMQSSIWSDQKEILDERKLRKQSEDLQRRLAQENSDLKSSYSLASKEKERERKARILVEKLCDEFAQEIRDYEHVVRTLRNKVEAVHFGCGEPERLVLHVAEAWLDARMQMKLAEAQNHLSEKDTISSKLRFEIETFLQARHSTAVRRAKGLPTDRTSNMCARRESFPLHEATSAPQHIGDEESSSDGDSNCFELNRIAGKGHYAVRSQQQDSRLLNLPSDQVQLKAPMTPDRNQLPLRTTGERRDDNRRRASSNNFVLDQRRKYSMSFEGDNNDSYVLPRYGGCASPTKQWVPRLTSPDFDKPQSSRKSFGDVETLRAKLLEARLDDQRARAKASEASSKLVESEKVGLEGM